MKEFDFDNVGKRMPYSVPEEFFEKAKMDAKSAAVGVRGFRHGANKLVVRLAVAATVALAVCGAAFMLEDFNSPTSRYERMLADVSTDVLIEYAYDYDTESEIYEETDSEYFY